MINIMTINNHKAIIKYDPEIEMLRGEFLDLSGGADFYATDVKGLKVEGEKSLKVYLDMCEEKGIEPYKSYSGKFNVRLSPELHAAAAAVAAANKQSLNEFVATTIANVVEHVEN